MTARSSWFNHVAEQYRRCTIDALDWQLDRMSPEQPFIDTKVHSISLRDYTLADGLRGPAYLYTWIQGRGLEAMVRFARHVESSNPVLAATLDQRALTLFHALDKLTESSGTAGFCYHQRAAVCLSSEAHDPTQPRTLQQRDPDLSTYSDLFVVKGLVAAAARLIPEALPAQLAHLDRIVQHIEDERFVIAEHSHITEAQLSAQPKSYGPRMIALGAAAMLENLGLQANDTFSWRFIEHVLAHYYDPASGTLSDTLGGDECNVGHAIEFSGLALETHGANLGVDLVSRLNRLTTTSFRLGYSGYGLYLRVALDTAEPLDSRCPWWSLPETIRAAALGYEATDDDRILATWQMAHDTFFNLFWRQTPPIAYQTRNADGPIDFVPATPDLDPGYHTGLSLLAAIEVLARRSNEATG